MNYKNVVDEIFSQIKGVRFAVRVWDETTFEYGTGDKKLFTLIFKTRRSAVRLMSEGALGFGECYMDGTTQIEGDIEAYLALRHQFKQIKPSMRAIIATVLARRRVRGRRKDQIAYHYDIGNEFFELFLDGKTMSYSAGLYQDKSDTLTQAQDAKLELACEWLDLPKSASVLDVGWGGFAVHAAQKHDWNIECVTLSNQQLAYCHQLIKQKSLSDTITLQYRDMIDNLPEKEYDAIVILESIEHVGQNNLKSFIDGLHKRLKPGGVIYLQTTGRYTPKQVDSWTLKYVFPGGYLPTKPELIENAVSSGFDVEMFIDDTQSYIYTLSEWIARLESHQSEIESMFSPSFYRLWHLWTHGAKVAFEVESMNLFRVKLTKPSTTSK
jgi:cyclopropane-fatty-acyl-phospholipid synthase